jgi:hypothetical protein
LACFQTGENGPDRLSTAFSKVPINLLSTQSLGVKLTGLKALGKLKNFGSAPLGNYKYNTKLKAQFKIF